MDVESQTRPMLRPLYIELLTHVTIKHAPNHMELIRYTIVTSLSH